MRCKQNFLIIYIDKREECYSCYLQMLYTPKDSKGALNHELKRVLYKQKNPCLCKKTVKLIYFDCVFAIRAYYQLLKQETSTKYRAHVHQKAVERHCYFEYYHRKCTK